jgi:hypothetical protein
LYRESTVSFGSTLHDCCRRIGPVSKPSSAQKIENPASLSPEISVLEKKISVTAYHDVKGSVSYRMLP